MIQPASPLFGRFKSAGRAGGNELTLYYQPQLETVSATCCGAKVLVC
jgi:hypothetical protein